MLNPGEARARCYPWCWRWTPEPNGGRLVEGVDSEIGKGDLLPERRQGNALLYPLPSERRREDGAHAGHDLTHAASARPWTLGATRPIGYSPRVSTTLEAGEREDVLSSVLQEVRLSGAVFFDVDAQAPWVADAPPAQRLAPVVMPGAQHVIAYHVIVSGSCWVRLSDDGAAPRELQAGTVVAFPHGDAHVLSSEPGLEGAFDDAVFEQPPPEDLTPFMLTRSGDGPASTRLICGFLGCDKMPFNPLLRALPRVLAVAGGYEAHGGWLRRLLDASMAEIQLDREGGRSVLARLSELVFIEAVRAHAETLPREERGWLNGLRHPHVGRALALLHERPAAPWTVATLASESGVSRSVLAESFKDCVGLSPMVYLSQWRMQIASRLLMNRDRAVAQIAEAVGYSSEAAFSRAFKRATGSSPASWRGAQA
jgi:AraC-like DNA-binding protein